MRNINPDQVRNYQRRLAQARGELADLIDRQEKVVRDNVAFYILAVKISRKRKEIQQIKGIFDLVD